MPSPSANWHRLSWHPQELAWTQRQSLAPAGNLWLLRVNPEQVRSGTAFLAPCFPISTGPASISSRVWGSVLTCFYCLLIIVFSLKRNIFFDKLKTSLCNKNAFRLSEQSLHLKNISGKEKYLLHRGIDYTKDFVWITTVQSSSVSQLCLTPCDPMDCSMTGFLVHDQLLELA